MLTVTAISKTFATRNKTQVRAVTDISLAVAQGKLLTLLGPSGCGKTTTLRCIAGLDHPDSGHIELAGRTVFDATQNIRIPSNAREIGMVFQSYAIWPHLNVFENIAFPLRVARQHLSSQTIRERVHRAMACVHLEGYGERPATQLSGGQQQRLALARGIVREPAILLLDEPLSNLDAKLREQMRLELKRIQSEFNIAMVYVTHDQTEALALSDEIVVFRAGQIVQRGTPREIYQHPRNQYVADFIGSANFIAGTAAECADAGSRMKVRTPHAVIECIAGETVLRDQPVLVTARPEDVELEEGEMNGAPNTLGGIITTRVYLGEVSDYLLDLGGFSLRVRDGSDRDIGTGHPVRIRIRPEKTLALIDETPGGARAGYDHTVPAAPCRSQKSPGPADAA
jgi:iron(III) transport system ATP-binding protein